jgi:hypothetical protein
LDISLDTVYRGSVKHVVTLRIDGKSAARDYLDEIEKIQPSEFDKLSQRIAFVADAAVFRNREIFNNEGNGIWAFKTSGGKRLYAFHDENQLLIACFGADKAKKKQQQKDIAAAVKWKDRYLTAKANNETIKIDGQIPRRKSH